MSPLKTATTTSAAIALVAFALSATANSFQPGEHDEEALRLLRAMAGAIPLRTTSLSKIAPDFAVEKHAGLAWEEAVAERTRALANANLTGRLSSENTWERDHPRLS